MYVYGDVYLSSMYTVVLGIFAWPGNMLGQVTGYYILLNGES